MLRVPSPVFGCCVCPVVQIHPNIHFVRLISQPDSRPQQNPPQHGRLELRWPSSKYRLLRMLWEKPILTVRADSSVEKDVQVPDAETWDRMTYPPRKAPIGLFGGADPTTPASAARRDVVRKDRVSGGWLRMVCEVVRDIVWEVAWLVVRRTEGRVRGLSIVVCGRDGRVGETCGTEETIESGQRCCSSVFSRL